MHRLFACVMLLLSIVSCRTDPAGGPRDQQGVLMRNSNTGQHVFRGGIGAGKGGQLSVAQFGMDREGIDGRDSDILRKAAVAFASEIFDAFTVIGSLWFPHDRFHDNPFADAFHRHLVADGGNPPDDIRALDAREGEAAAPGPLIVIFDDRGVFGRAPDCRGIPALAGVDVRIVDTAGTDADEYLMRTGGRHG